MISFLFTNNPSEDHFIDNKIKSESKKLTIPQMDNITAYNYPQIISNLSNALDSISSDAARNGVRLYVRAAIEALNNKNETLTVKFAQTALNLARQDYALKHPNSVLRDEDCTTRIPELDDNGIPIEQ